MKSPPQVRIVLRNDAVRHPGKRAKQWAMLSVLNCMPKMVKVIAIVDELAHSADDRHDSNRNGQILKERFH